MVKDDVWKHFEEMFKNVKIFGHIERSEFESTPVVVFGGEDMIQRWTNKCIKFLSFKR